MYDERASALFDESGDHKAIAKRDMLLFDQKEKSLSVNENETLNAAYTLVEEYILLKKIGISFRLDIAKLGQIDLLTLKHGGYVRLTQEKILMHLVTETGEYDIDMSVKPPIGKLRSFDMYWYDGTVGVRYGKDKAEFEIPEGYQDKLEVTGFFGHVSETTANIYAISVEPWVTERAMEIVEKTLVDEMAKSVDNEIMSDLLRMVPTGSTTPLMSEHIAERRRKMGIPESGLGPPSIADKERFDALSFPLIRSVLPQLLKNSQSDDTMNETILAYLTRITGLNEEDLKALDRKELIRLVYNGIANDPLNARAHHEILKEAHYAAARFLDGDQSLTTPDVSIGDKTYNTFEFGEVNRINCTPQRLLYLVKTYPEVWLKRLV